MKPCTRLCMTPLARCGGRCSCEQVQLRLVVRKVRRDHPEQWRRVVAHHRPSC